MQDSLTSEYQASEDGAFDARPATAEGNKPIRQLKALLINDLRLVRKRFLATLLYMLAPSLVVLGLWGLDSLVTVDDFSDSPVPLAMTPCAAFDRFGKVTDERSCVTVMYAPADAKHDAFMQKLAEKNGLVVSARRTPTFLVLYRSSVTARV